MSDGMHPIRDPFEAAIAERLAKANEAVRLATQNRDQIALDRASAVQGELTAILDEVTQRVHGLGRWKPNDRCDTVPARRHAGAWEMENPELSARIWWRLLNNFYHTQFAIEEVWKWCESPIERSLIAAIMTDPGFNLDAAPVLVSPTTRWKPPTVTPEQAYLVIAPQYRVDGFRLDCAVYFSQTGKRAAIECDGHEFHDRTKEQAQRDKSRDRALMAAGWPVMRFTGSEIHADPLLCAKQVSNVLTGITPDDRSAAFRSAAE